MVKLIDDWRRVLSKAWSIRLLMFAGLLSGVEVALPFLGGLIPHGLFAALSLIVTAGAFVARIVAQKDFEDET